ncbi:MAG: glycosyltransferase [Phycisphaera sp.]|nr:glycosyltransferase [Phycisphaera sp.]
MSAGQLKDWIRNSALWPAINHLRASRFEAAYRQRRDTYLRKLTEQGKTYNEQATVAAIRKQLIDRGYKPTPRKVGQIGTFSVIGQRSWHDDLLVSLKEFGPLHNCDHAPFELFRLRGSELAAARRRFADHLLHDLAQTLKQQAVDWVFVYGGGRIITPDTINRIHEQFGLPTVNMCLDDKNAWAGPVVEGVDNNQSSIASAYDMVWTSASVACDWYLAEGGRAVYLPEGCLPSRYTATTDRYDIPVSFLGACYGPRPGVIRKLLRHGVDIKVFGKGWGKLGAFAIDPVDIFSRSTVNFGIGGIAFSEMLTNVKGRDFDVPCTGGGAYLTAFNPDLARSFDVGREILCYRNLEEAVEMANHYAHHPDDCRVIATRARERCLKEHTWVHRYARIAQVLGVMPQHTEYPTQPRES